VPLTETHLEEIAQVGYAVEYRSGKRETHGKGPPAFTISVADESHLQRLLRGNAYSAALEFLRGQCDISGDLVAALRLKQKHSHPGFSDRLWHLAARIAPVHFETWFQSRKRAAENIRFHYDISNDFYRAFLDSRLVYSAAQFEHPSWSLDQAQEAKLKRICEELDLRAGDRFLDIGSGWGGLLIYAAERHKVSITGCTLSHHQYEFTDSLIHARGLEQCASVRELDYRDLSRRFDKIASVGMFEHVGRHRLGKYFRKIYSLLERHGLFLNSGIVRPENVTDDPQTWFLLRRVFPGGELAHLSEVIHAAEKAGFGIIKIESLRKDYARTCEEWVRRLRRNKDTCVGLVGKETFRTWLLYLAASAVNFEAGTTDVFSILMTRA